MDDEELQEIFDEYDPELTGRMVRERKRERVCVQERECVYEGERENGCVLCVRVSVCVCMKERERMCVCVCVCVCVKEAEKGSFTVLIIAK